MWCKSKSFQIDRQKKENQFAYFLAPMVVEILFCLTKQKRLERTAGIAITETSLAIRSKIIDLKI